MEFTVKSGSPEKQRSACVIAGVYESRQLSAAAEQLDRASNGAIGKVLQKGDLEGKLGESLLLHSPGSLPCERVLLIGCGLERELDDGRYRQVCAESIRRLENTGATEAVSYLAELQVMHRDGAWKVQQAVQTSRDVLYRYDASKSKKDTTRQPLRKLVLAVSARAERSAAERALRIGVAVAEGVRLAKDLGNLPANICTPTYLAEQAAAMAKHYPPLSVKSLERKDMEKLGMGALLSVARGSEQPPKLIVFEYRNGPKKQHPIVLVGKGVTFDSGGISIKPAKGMDEMKFDMCGAASVFGAVKTCAELQLPMNLVGLVPATENLPSGAATKPGDVVTSLSGQTIEILNTDAEGRLILCDALTYAERYEPDTVIDMATLTGAIIVALGRVPHGLFSNHQDLAKELLDAGQSAADRAWEMPLWEDYQEQLKTNFADMANIGGPDGGAITAASFLARFTEKYHWAHLDIAGTAWKVGEQKGATGRPVPLLAEFLMGRCGFK
jgi:leucyl aminopeptidase